MLSLLLVLASTSSAPPADVKVPPGFTITSFAENALAPDIYTMTIDDAGRVLVAGRGYVRVLVDDDNDGIADRAIDLIDGLKDGPMGLLAEGDSLFVVSEGGLQRFRGYNGRDKLKRPPETLVKLKTTGEHEAHMARRGPDGWLYLLCGNSAGVAKSTITGPLSPIKEPIAGALLRISPDGKQIEVVCDGFRNPYSFDFNLEGEPFASDSDNERCVGLPWYESCRFYHLMPGGNYGWRSPQLDRFWRKPPYFFDCVPPVAYLGRGSPTGVACYRHSHFPGKYRGGFFLADWTFGRIDFVPLTEQGSSYTGKPEVFAEAVGTSGFAPTGLSVHPITGELFVSIGGRGTRGGVYRIAHANSAAGEPLPVAKRSLAWDRDSETSWREGCKWNGTNENLGPPSRWRTRRQSLEQLSRHVNSVQPDESLGLHLKQLLDFPDPFIRMNAARIVASMRLDVGKLISRTELLVAYNRLDKERDQAADCALKVISWDGNSAKVKQQGIRLLQLAYGDLTAKGSEGTIWEGYTLRNPEKIEPPTQLLAALRSCLSSGTPELQREAARTLAALGGDDEFISILTARLAGNSTIEEDIHHLACVGMVKKRWTASDTGIVVDWLLNLERKVTTHKTPRDQNWPLRLEEILQALGKNNPELATRLLNHPEFGKPEHVLFVKPLNMKSMEAAKRFLNASARDPEYRWTGGLIRLLKSLPRGTTQRVLARLWDEPQLRDAILSVLAAEPETADAPKFVLGLASFDPATVQASAKALASLSVPATPAEYAAAIKALRSSMPEDKTTREAIHLLLKKRSGESLSIDAKAWTEWATRNYPEVQKLLLTSDGFDAAAWKKREANIPWDRGDATRGRAVFTRASCAGCHDGGRAMGPSLLGAGKRFSRDDLLTAILQPSKDVSPRYRPTRVMTTGDAVYIGMIVYEATDGLILQTGPDSVVRIAGDTIASKTTSTISMMPAGLLDKLSDQEIADLFRYLQTNDVAKSQSQRE